MLVVAAIVLIVTGRREIEADSVADFNFAVTQDAVGARYNRTSELRISKIFQEYLDDGRNLRKRASVSQAQAHKLAHTLVQLCRKYRFDPAFILSLIQVESSFRIRAVSGAGAVGLMQLMPDTARFISHHSGLEYKGRSSLFDPKTNLSLGIRYMAFLRDKYAGLPPYFHIAAYNIGPARLDELLSRKNFKPSNTKRYYEKIKRGIPTWRYYPVEASSAAQQPGA
jgi:soluble lytic murein transglycosylase-like protein